MSNPKARMLPTAVSLFMVMFAVYCADIFLFRTDAGVLGDTVFAALFGGMILYLHLKASGSSVKSIGISKKQIRISAGLLYGAFFSLIPLLLVSIAEGAYFVLTDIMSIDIHLETPNMVHVNLEKRFTPSLAAIIYILTSFIGVFFKEVFFRGFLLRSFNKTSGFTKANITQAVLYMVFVLPLLIRMVSDWLGNGKYSFGMTAFVVVFCIAHELITGLKWGLITRISGTVYMAIVDHYLYAFLAVCLFVTDKHTVATHLIRLAVIQFISFVLVAVYYSVGMKKIKTKKEQEKSKLEARQKEAEARRQKRKAEFMQKKLENVDEISPNAFKSMTRESGRNHRKKPTDESALESRIELEKALSQEVSHENVEDIDAILRSATKEMHRRENPTKPGEITDTFDSDDFLSSYGKKGSSHHRHHHRHHHRSNSVKEEKVVLPPQKKQLAKKPKRTLAQKIQSFGGVDTSSSNELI